MSIRMIPYISSAPARHRKAIALCCDGSFLKFACFFADQIDRQSPSRDFDICICSHEAIRLPDSLADLNLRLCQFDIGDGFENARTDHRISHAAYLRILLPTVFAREYDRILYLDTDMFLTGGNLSRLLEVPLNGRPIGAVRDKTQARTPSRMLPEFKAAGLPHAPYFNSGLVLFDVKAWLEQDLLTSCQRIIRNHGSHLRAYDQSALNIAVHNNWAELSPVWNWPYSSATNYFIEILNPRIIHFIVWRKPWSLLGGEIPRKYTEPYRQFFLKHYPDYGQSLPKAKPISAARKFHKKSLLKHWYHFDRLMPYLDRFEDDFTVR